MLAGTKNKSRERKMVALGLVLESVMLLSIATSCAAKTAAVDIQALQQIKSSIDPSTLHSSSCLGSWDFSHDPCDATSSTSFVCGIRCDEELQEEGASTRPPRRVTSIVLDGYGYRGFLSPFVGNLSALQALDVSGNALSGALPASLGKLARLRRLDVSGNAFSGGIPESLGELRSLEHLGLARNALSGTIPASLSRLSSLRRLDLYSNLLSGELPIAMPAMSSLLYLDASSNRITGSFPGRLPPSLVRLSLRDNRLSGQLPSNLGDMAALEVLDVSRNGLWGALPDSIFLHPSLQQVNVAGNAFQWIQTPGLAAMPLVVLGSKMVALDASHNRLRGPLPPFLAELPRLSSLSLTGNMLGGTIPLQYAIKAVESAVGIQPLRRLFLDGNLLVGALPFPFLTWSPSATLISASFANNCLHSCPPSLPFCGAQRPATQCS
ncbi:LRR receptor-like serine/threonine-protein kinase FLS2 [Selaginella moellendorffii]|nr:LRR receptor-like serine/threonine-protein kinase FLS2 [Selaginella moellendorffii]|eukprot:XP_002981118.2 LRR receptor-like serine/threonine-protein kinase FLS2 [Selaginella moellendorffii]